MAAKDDKFEHLNSLDEARTVHIESEKSALQAANAKLRRLNEARDDFLNELCHELRAPLISVMSFLEFLREDSLPPEEIKTLSGFLHCEVERLETLVSDMLDLAKMEAGGLQHIYTESDLNDIAVQCISIVAIAAKRRNISLRLIRDPTLPSLALAANRIKQVIINMLDNALKHSKIGGEIVVTIENRPDDVCLSVRDFGLGIEPKDIQKVFSRFERIEVDGKESVGTGLGMPLAKNIIESGHNGRIWVQSDGRNKGTTFSFSIPKQSLSHQSGDEERETMDLPPESSSPLTSRAAQTA